MTWNDPNASAEAQRYVNPIPSRELILRTITEYGEATHQQLAKAFNIDDSDQIEALANRLKAMVRDGQINREGRPSRFRAVTQQDVVSGTVSAHAKGFGFVVLADMPDLFLHEEQMRWVFNGDKVNAVGTSIDSRGRTEGRIVEITERHQDQFIGTLARDEEGYCVELGSPNNHQPITVTDENVQALEAKQGAPVKVDVINSPISMSLQLEKSLKYLVMKTIVNLLLKRRYSIMIFHLSLAKRH